MHTNKPECGIGKGKELITHFATYIKKAFNLENVQRQPNLVTLIGRRKYVAHPRVNLALFNSSSVSREMINEVSSLRVLCVLVRLAPSLAHSYIFIYIYI